MQTPNYVAKLRVNVLRAKGLKRLGHIFHFATLPVRLQGRFIRQGLPLRHRQQCRVVCVHPSCPPLPSSVSSSCVEGRCAFEHHRSSGLHRFTPGALAPTRLCSPGLHRLSGPIRPTRHLATFSLPGRLYVASLLCRSNRFCAA
jgi:hypothetical protein